MVATQLNNMNLINVLFPMRQKKKEERVVNHALSLPADLGYESQCSVSQCSWSPSNCTKCTYLRFSLVVRNLTNLHSLLRRYFATCGCLRSTHEDEASSSSDEAGV